MRRLAQWALVLVLFAIAVALLGGGAILIGAGGSLYYAGAGLAVLVAAGALTLGRGRIAVAAYGAMLAATLGWSLWEVRLDGWALAPRLIGPAVVGTLVLWAARTRAQPSPSQWWIGAPVIGSLVVLLLAGGLAVVPDYLSRSRTPPTPNVAASTEWRHWGNTVGGSRYVPASQIHTGNVDRLKLAWRFDSDAPAQPYVSFELTPLAADGRLYACLQPGIVAALDQDSGRQLWRYTTPGFERFDFSKIFGGKCRGVSYHESPRPLPECRKRVLFGAPDGTLVAVDAATGRRCSQFGKGGAVDLLAGMGLPSREILAMPSSPPAIVNGVAVVGQSVSDLESLDAPSGVIRGYDAETGELTWAWDAGRPGQTQLRPGETYTRSTPNAWAVLSGDERLGLVYVPTGNTLPDYYGGARSQELGRYASSVVALDAATGAVRWTFQTVHHDLWDYDVASQPVVVDLPSANGPVPALIVPTKRGEIFVLDRRTGQPVDPVVERPVPRGGVPGERPSPTQPFTTGFPSVSGPDIRENDMWGITPLDQLWCRIQFRKARYHGQFTPVGTSDTLMYPGTAGGINWGSVSIDPRRGLMMVNALRFANFGRLIPREEAASMAFGGAEGWATFEQAGTPYAFAQKPFMSPLQVPCVQPPYGTIHVFDLKTRKPVWNKSFGTAARSGPFGLPTLLPIRMGVPNMGGSILTAGGVGFIGAAQDRRLRAYDVRTGRELWSALMPAVPAATPMSYVSPRTGRQYVVIAAGGHYGLPGPAEAALLAFALPDRVSGAAAQRREE